MHAATDGYLDPFVDEGWIDEILYEVKSGKEATVFCCRAGSAAPNGHTLLAAKVYRCLHHRTDADSHAHAYSCTDTGTSDRAHRLPLTARWESGEERSLRDERRRLRAD